MADQIQEIKQKADIVSIIGEHVELKKAGSNYKALCPFHSEKTPSFMVSPELQIYKCFGCGAGGDVYNFLQEYEGMDFYEALKYLAERAGVKLKPIKGRKKSGREKIFEVNTLANHFYKYVLLKHPSGRVALDYLKNDRQLKMDTIKRFGLGFSPDKPFAIKSYLVDKKKLGIKDLEEAGLIYTRDGRSYDRFRGRVIFPLFDHRGNVAGFAGRLLPGAKKELAKYINTPETDAYYKSKILYALNVTRKEIKQKGSAVITEGELDAISSWQAGIKNVVAIKGSALTQEQIKLLGRYTQKIILALDADVAGDAAARRGIELAEKEGFDIRVARLKDYKDPDEAARKDPDALKDAIERSVGIWDFIIDGIFDRHKGTKDNKQSRISREVVPVLYSIKDKIVQAHYVKGVARRLKVPEEAVAEQVSEFKGEEKKRKPQVEFVKPKERKGRRELLEERLLSLVFKLDPSRLLKKEITELLDTSLTKRIAEKYKDYMEDRKEFDPSEFADYLPEELVEGFTDMVLKDVEGMENARKNELEKELAVVYRALSTADIKAELNELVGKINKLESKKKKKELEDAKKRFGELTRSLHEIEEKEIKGILL